MDYNSTDSSTEFSLSENKNQCIGPCYKKSTVIIHPPTGLYVTDHDADFCPIIPKKDDKKRLVYVDECKTYSHTKDISTISNINTPSLGFSCIYFLKEYYDISNIEDVNEFVTVNTHLPLLTKSRICNCGLTAFGTQIEILPDNLIEFYIEFISDHWINNIYKEIYNYIGINSYDKPLFIKPESNILKKEDNMIVRKNYIITKLINIKEIKKFFIFYFDTYKIKWNSIKNHHTQLKKDIIIFILKKIKVSYNIV
jgi:hypothetical protein